MPTAFGCPFQYFDDSLKSVLGHDCWPEKLFHFAAKCYDIKMINEINVVIAHNVIFRDGPLEANVVCKAHGEST